MRPYLTFTDPTGIRFQCSRVLRALDLFRKNIYLIFPWVPSLADARHKTQDSPEPINKQYFLVNNADTDIENKTYKKRVIITQIRKKYSFCNLLVFSVLL